MPQGTVNIRRFKGVNLAVAPRDIADDQLVEARNTYPVERGMLCLRPNTEEISGFGNVEGLGENVIFIPLEGKNQDQPDWLIWADHFGATTGPTYAKLMRLSQASGFWEILDNLPGDRKPDWLRWQDKIYLFVGQDHHAIIIDTKKLPTSSADLSYPPAKSATETNGWDIRPRVGWVYRGSFCLANFGDERSSIRFCQIYEPDTLLTSAKTIYLQRGDGDEIVAAREVTVEGGSQFFEPYSVIWKRHSTWLMQGYPPTFDDAGSLSLMPLFRQEGLVAKETIAQTPHGLIWCSGENVYLAPPGGKPVPIGNDIAPYLRSLAQFSPYWHAAYINDCYRLTVPDVFPHGASVNNEGGFPQTVQWWCDLRNPAAPEWWGPQEIPEVASAVTIGSDGIRRHVGMGYYRTSEAEAEWFMHAHDKILEDNKDGFTGMGDCPAPATTWRFKEFDFGDDMLKKIISAIELHYWADRDGAFSIQWVGNGGMSASDADASTITGGGFILGGNLGGRIGKEFKTIAVYPPNAERFVVNTFQPVIKSATSVNLAIRAWVKSIGIRFRPIGRRP